MRHSDHRIVRIRREERVEWGVVDGGDVLQLRGWPTCGPLSIGGMTGTLADFELFAPVAPTKIVCVGRNYVAHADEHGVQVPAEPLLFLKPPSSVVGPGEGIVLPSLSDQVEHEAELAVVIGRRAREVAVEEAWDFVLGVTCANDITARDLQRRDGQWTRGKGFDTFCPIGPWIVTGLSEAEVGDLQVCCRVNGELRQRGRTREMVFPPSRLIAAISAVMTLEPGDVILTGTPSGVSPLAAGDVVEVEIEKVGVLTNPVT